MVQNESADSRLELLMRWLRDDLGFAGCPVEPASADASFRRYFRVTRRGESCIVMDAPPDKEDLGPYLHVARMLGEIGLNVPRVLAHNLEDGLLLLTDLGTRLYLPELGGAGAADRLYADALAALARMQTAGRAGAASLPAYDHALLMREMELLPDWFLLRHLGIAVDPATRALLDAVFEALARAALEQPASFVHRDYHSRNLLVVPAANPGIIDFQDACRGPVTYDLVSLLKDCYVDWPAARVEAWALGYRRRLLDEGFALPADARGFLRWFHLMGLQRHIKVLGIFCRLHYRDGKAQYLRDLPRVLGYVRSAAQAYPETAEFAAFLAEHVEPNFPAAQARALA